MIVEQNQARIFNGRTFDRVYIQRQRQFQARYPMTAVITPEGQTDKEQNIAIKRGWRFWGRPAILDQGSEGACTGFSAATCISAGPVRPKKHLSAEDALALYFRARQLDEWPGESYDGSSVDGAAKALREKGLVSEFYWGRELETVTTALLLEGPVIFGLDWTVGMMEPDADGFLRATGAVVGGHAICGVGVNLRKVIKVGGVRFKGYVTLANSWGTGYGKKGFCYLPLDDLAKLIDGIEYPGDACIVKETRAA